MLPLEVLQAGQEFLHGWTDHERRDESRGQAQRTPGVEQHRLQDHQQDAHGAERADREPENDYDLGHGAPALATADEAGNRIQQVAEGPKGGIRDRQEA